MARPSAMTRDLSLTEELERLEQSITLTLQEIDHNFSKAHRIVTASILPLVEQYGDHSRAVWEASKFWKQFFEASANVSLSGYEELANDDEDETATADESTQLREDITADYSAEQGSEQDLSTATVTQGQGGFEPQVEEGESILDDAELSGSTPRPPATKTTQYDVSNIESPYESMKREMKIEDGGREGEGLKGGRVEEANDQTTFLEDDDDSTVLFAQRTARLPEMSITPEVARKLLGKDRSGQKTKDPLLHRVLNKNYRVQATPQKSLFKVSPLKADDRTTTTKTRAKTMSSWRDGDSPASSPEMVIPKLRSEAFISPYKSTTARMRLTAATSAGQGPRTPGVSVQTPAAAFKSKDVFAGASTAAGRASGGKAHATKGAHNETGWNSDDYDEDSEDIYGGMSPPKTIQFALPPSKLLQTPAREASRKIVGNILLDAGEDPESSEYSPTMVKMNEDVLDDSF